jgi:hypothetical protein
VRPLLAAQADVEAEAIELEVVLPEERPADDTLILRTFRGCALR